MGYTTDFLKAYEGVDLALRVSCADDYDGEWGGQPEDFAIYRSR